MRNRPRLAAARRSGRSGFKVARTSDSGEIMLGKMVEALQLSSAQDACRHTLRIQTITIIWMSVEAAVSLWAAWAAWTARSRRCSALAATASLNCSRRSVWAERPAATVAGVLLFALAAFVALASVFTLLGWSEPRLTKLGVAILLVAAVFCHGLLRGSVAWRRLSAALRSKTDATESAMCGYFSLIALAGLLLNSFWHISWADPVCSMPAPLD